MGEWVEIAEKLKINHGWNPVYWIGHSEIATQIENLFPNVTFHSKWNASKTIPPEEYKNVETQLLDTNVLAKYRPYRATTLRLMDRMDAGNCFTYDERVRSYHRLLRYWISVIQIEDVDVAVFSRVPHDIASYIICAICNENNIHTIMFKPVHHLPKQLIQHSISGVNPELKSMWSNNYKNINVNDISSESKNAIKKLSGEYSKPSYMENNTKSSDLSKFQYLKLLPGLLSDKLKTNNNEKLRNKTLENSSMTNVRYQIRRKLGKVEKYRLKKCYQEISTQPDFSESYIYVPLHYQPERTTVPDGGVYGEQFLMLDILSDTIPDEWKLFVKEHPSQFSSNSKGERGRYKYDYKDIEELNGVNLVEIECSSFELIDNANAVATITGTAGWESVIRGTPSIVFGNAWYRLCPGVQYTRTVIEVETAIENIQKDPTVSRRDVLSFVRAVEIAGHRGYISPSQNSSDQISSKENINNIASSIYNSINLDK